MAAPVVSASLRALLDAHPSIETIPSAPGSATAAVPAASAASASPPPPLPARLRCRLTGHEMPLREDAVARYVGGATYAKARDWYSKTGDLLKAHAPWIVPHRASPKHLFCRLTRDVLNAVPEQVEAHV